MIETTALFFSIVAIKYFIDIVKSKPSYKNQLLYLLFITLSILQKATTGLPVLLVLCFVYFTLNVKESNSFKSFFINKSNIYAFIYFGFPIIISIIWVSFADHVRALNGIGLHISQKGWYWGTIKQRLSLQFYKDVLWYRIFKQNLSGLLGIAILTFALCSKTKTQTKFIILVSLFLGLIPLFLFTNVHIVHTYYQAANVVFLIYAIAVSLGSVLNQFWDQKIIAPLVLIFLLVFNYYFFNKDYFSSVKIKFNTENSRDYDISSLLKREIPEQKYFIAFGNDWSSSFAYLSERKSFTVPEFFQHYKSISLHPEYFMEENKLGGIVMCPPALAPFSDLLRWTSRNNRYWKIGKTHDCYIAVPENSLQKIYGTTQHTNCKGAIDSITEKRFKKQNTLTIEGWTTILSQNETIPKRIYISLSQKGKEPIYFEALQVNRSNINDERDSGFSRIINVSGLSGEYFLDIVRLNKDHFEQCQFHKQILLNA